MKAALACMASVGLAVLAACGMAGTIQSPAASAPLTPGGQTGAPPSSVTDLPQTDVPSAVLASVVADAARLANVSIDQVAVLKAQRQTWPDSSLGCPRPDEIYTQAVVNGFWVVLQTGADVFDYRLDSRGSFALCAGGPGRKVNCGDLGVACRNPQMERTEP